MVKLIINKLHKDAVIPKEMNEGDACLDLYTIEEVTIEPFKVVLLRTGLRIVIPIGYEGIIRPRSGLSIKCPNYIANSPGTIDSGYRDEVKIIYFNNTPNTTTIEKLTRIGQIGIRKTEVVEIFEVESAIYNVYKNENDRGGGFGSTNEKDDQVIENDEST